MDMASTAKEYIDSQKRAANNFFDVMTLVQDFADKRQQFWAEQMGVNEKMETVVDEWRVVFKKGRDDSIKMVNDGFTSMDKYLDELSHQKNDRMSANNAEQSLWR